MLQIFEAQKKIPGAFGAQFASSNRVLILVWVRGSTGGGGGCQASQVTAPPVIQPAHKARGRAMGRAAGCTMVPHPLRTRHGGRPHNIGRGLRTPASVERTTAVVTPSAKPPSDHGRRRRAHRAGPAS